jgi:hypothetical protein
LRAATAAQVGARAWAGVSAWADVAVLAIGGFVFAVTATLRAIDGDEGAYLGAASLMVEHGRLPYRDFLYTQTPLLPYVYGVWAELTGESWYTARLLSVTFAAALGWLLYRHLEGRYGRSLGLVGVALYAGAELALLWYSTVKTYALGTLLLFGAYVLASRATGTWTTWAAAGLLVGAAIDVRLILAGAVPALAWCALRSSGRALAAAAGGLAVGLIPCFVFLAVDANAFLFDNVWYHGSRSPGGLIGDFGQKARTVASLLGIETGGGRAHPQYLLLTLAAVGGAMAGWVLTRRVSPALLFAGFLALASVAPTPTYAQYFAVTVPFLVVAAVELVAVLDAQTVPAAPRRTLAAVGAAALAAYLAIGATGVARALRSAPQDRPSAIDDVAAFVDERTRPREEVLAAWPGYLFGTDGVPVPGLENDFGPHQASARSADEAHRYHLATVDDVEQMIRMRRTRTIVVTPWNNILPPVPRYELVARDSGYRLLGQFGGVRVYGLPDAP